MGLESVTDSASLTRFNGLGLVHWHMPQPNCFPESLHISSHFNCYSVYLQTTTSNDNFLQQQTNQKPTPVNICMHHIKTISNSHSQPKGAVFSDFLNFDCTASCIKHVCLCHLQAIPIQQFCKFFLPILHPFLFRNAPCLLRTFNF